ncbi:glycosyl hydrolase family 18 protein [Kitasatospora sp. CB01950]|uniref:glycosyl hydrolase family 18 protein n=1 Tax=Kitasatospora sp. CB01950 TaxID=1703930 RepID=UPI00093B1D29|nr:glycosyl hydrolase family 18 protein [Kitasatospora sp. CB01950]
MLTLAAGLLGLVTASPAAAVPGSPPLITWNMQGAQAGGQSKWTVNIGNMVNGAVTPPILALQEMGSGLPPQARGTTRENLTVANGGLLPVPAAAGLQGTLPPYANPGGPQEVRHGQWASGGINHDVYFLQTDPNGDSWGGGRVNLGFVTERGADDVVVLPNPLGPQTGWAARATLGLRFGGTWYFTVHALSGSHGSDAPGLLANIGRFVANRGQGEDWVALGDWNREPASLQAAGLPAGAGIFSSEHATHRDAGELDYAVYSNGNPGGVMVAPMVNINRDFLDSDHMPVLVGQLTAAATHTQSVGGRAVESMAAGGVLDVYHERTANLTPIDSYVRSGQSNQSWTLDFYGDSTVRFQGEGSGRCIDITNSEQNPGSGRSLSLWDCSDTASQRWTPVPLGNDQYQFQSVLLPSLCMNIEGGQSDPNLTANIVLYGCENTPNERWIITPAHPSNTQVAHPDDLSRITPATVTIGAAISGGVLDAYHERTANDTDIVSWHRNGLSNQGWIPHWRGDNIVTFEGVGSHRCVDIYQSDRNVTAGRKLVLWDCSGGTSQLWHAYQLDDGQVVLQSVLYPDLCMDVAGAPSNPDNGYLDAWNCNANPNQQFILSPFDLTGSPQRDTDPDRFESYLRIATPDPGQPAQRVGYYTGWSTYANAFYPKNLDTDGIAGKLTVLNYAFENIDPVNLTCMAANKPSSPDESDTTGNDGSADAYADYQKIYTSDISVDGSSDSWDQPLRGNFNQLKQLKAKYPNLKVLVSIGGWTYSKYFSDAAATDDARKKFVSSCIDMYIKGNLPTVGNDPAGGTGAAAGVFDGFDIDWEFPGSANGHAGNHVSPQDGANYTALLNEFRSELNALGGQHMLTSALPAGPREINNLDLPSIAGALDLGDVMTYDMHGAFETNGPTNFQAPLYDSPASPAFGTGFTVNDAITHYLGGGFPAGKLALGVPFYGRGWTGAPDGGQHGRYQSVTGPTAPFPLSQQPGTAVWKELKAAGLTGNYYYDQQARSTWIYDGTNFWSIETPDSLADKRQYIKTMGLGGVMIYSLDGDDSSSTLLNAATGMGN